MGKLQKQVAVTVSRHTVQVIYKHFSIVYRSEECIYCWHCIKRPLKWLSNNGHLKEWALKGVWFIKDILTLVVYLKSCIKKVATSSMLTVWDYCHVDCMRLLPCWLYEIIAMLTVWDYCMMKTFFVNLIYIVFCYDNENWQNC